MGQPAAISHQVVGRLPLHQCLTGSTIRPLCVLLYPEAAKLKILTTVRQFCTLQCGRLENIRLAHSYCPENISVKDAGSASGPTFICELSVAET
jgi:hypothetical protein